MRTSSNYHDNLYFLCLYPSDRFIIIASDGVWDVMSNEEAVSHVTSALLDVGTDSNDLAIVCDQLLELCLEKGSQDNMSVIIVMLNELSEDENRAGPESTTGSIFDDLATAAKKLFND